MRDWDNMIRRPAPVPIIAVALLLAAWLATARFGSVNHVRCEADYQELIADIEANRQSALAEINGQLAEAAGGARAALEAMREKVWDEEESQRGRAQAIRTDCLRASRR